MIRISEFEVVGLKWALKAMREPYESMNRSESVGGSPFSGNNDKDLAKRLIKGGVEHRKFLRFPDVYLQITAPRYWWSEFDTYRFGVEKSSSSTMHLLMKRKLSVLDFSTDDDKFVEGMLDPIVKFINMNVEMSESTKSGEIKTQLLRQAKSILPESFNQERIVKISYETLMKIFHERNNHRLQEWKDFCDWILTLPSMSEFIGGMKTDEV